MLDHSVVGEAGRVYAFAGRELRAFECLTEGSPDFADARDVRDHVGVVVHAMEVDQRLRQSRVRPRHLMEDVEAPPKRVRGFGSFQRVAPQVVRGLPFARQRAAIEGALEVANGAAPPFEACLPAGFGKIVDLVQVVLAAEPRLLDGAERELLFVARVEPVVEARGLDLGLVRARRREFRRFRWCRAIARRGEGQDSEQRVQRTHADVLYAVGIRSMSRCLAVRQRLSGRGRF